MALSDQTVRRIWKVLAAILVVIALLYSSYIFFDVLIMLTISILIALILNPLVMLFEKNGVSRVASVFIAFGIATVVIVGGFMLLIPKIAAQMNTIASTVNQEDITLFIEKLEEDLKSFLPLTESTDLADKLSAFISEILFSSFDNISNIISNIISIVALIVIVPFMTFFLLKDSNSIFKGIINVMPNKYFEVSYYVLNQISEQLGRFVRGWLLDALFVGGSAAIGLAILGIDNSLVIGLIAGIGHLIPYFGPIIGGLPAVIISVIQFGDFSKFPSIVIMLVIIYTIDNGYVQPNIFSKSTDIHPLWIIILILIGSQLLGIFGMLLAVPVATVVKTAVKEIYFGFKNYSIIRAGMV